MQMTEKRIGSVVITHTHTSRCAAAALDLCCSTQGDFRPKSLAENLAEISFCLDFLKTF